MTTSTKTAVLSIKRAGEDEACEPITMRYGSASKTLPFIYRESEGENVADHAACLLKFRLDLETGAVKIKQCAIDDRAEVTNDGTLVLIEDGDEFIVEPLADKEHCARFTVSLDGDPLYMIILLLPASSDEASEDTAGH